MKEIIINHFLNYEFIYIFLFCSVIFLLISIFVKQKIIRKISILFFSIFFVLFCFELILFFLFGQCAIVEKEINVLKAPIKDKFTYEKEIFLVNTKTGSTHRLIFDKNDEIEKELKKYIKMGYEKNYDNIFSLYSNGLRYTKANPQGKKTYIFLGGSFTFGSCLGDNETLPYYFSELNKFNANVLNLGRGSKGSNYTLNILNSEVINSLVDKDKQITFFFYSLICDHINRNFRMVYGIGGSDPWIKENDRWKFTANHRFKTIKIFFIRSCLFNKIFSPIIDELNLKYYEDYLLSSLKKINEIIQDKYKSKLAIIVWPEFHKDFIIKLTDLNVDLIFLPEYFNSEILGYKLKDHHPTAKANKEIAEMLYNHINKIDTLNKET